MFLVREVFHAKPGKAKELVKIFKNMSGELEESGIKNTRILTDSAANYWTVIIESEVEDLNAYINMSHNASASVNKNESNKEQTQEIKDYRDLVIGGFREIFRIEN